MTAYLVRHAKAGDRDDWDGDDRLRPLSQSGTRQAEGIAQLLRDASLNAVLSSPYLRCIQTVEPIAQHFGLHVLKERRLAEGSGAAGVLEVIRERARNNILLCSHGDIIQDFLERLVEEGVVARKRLALEKGSTWVVDAGEGRIASARYIPPPV